MKTGDRVLTISEGFGRIIGEAENGFSFMVKLDKPPKDGKDVMEFSIGELMPADRIGEAARQDRDREV